MPCHTRHTKPPPHSIHTPPPHHATPHDKQSYLVPIRDVLKVHEAAITIRNSAHQICGESNAIHVHANSSVGSHQRSKVNSIPKFFEIGHSATIYLLQSHVGIGNDEKQKCHLTSEDEERETTDVQFKSHGNYTLEVENPSKFRKLKKKPY